MTKLYEDWKKQGLEILAVPCNQFNNQESGTNAEIHSFVKDKFKSAFPLLEKIEVNG
jgi:glutathione peroxidase